ncbi:prolow-density lipoprotein receptor-related protein 1-like [Pomacea canaliculata]|uniref:prolow-density lipoprotein receptor-related protein 1-like n=1 Tax=Pomacea canaliculata TaxID=400727 RepID=UPI000D72E047|nr:prolow-density lipoprotein receptor-related protein 1-like [Pomacea canaliculata]
MCDNRQQCYAKTQLCDNKNDCADKSDEAECTCTSGFCSNGGQCSVKAGVGPTCNCINNYSGFYCTEALPLGQQGTSSTRKWAVPVGVILGLLVIGATVCAIVFLLRRNRRLGLRFPFALQRFPLALRRFPFTFRRQAGTDDGLSNPVFDYGTGEADFLSGELDPPTFQDFEEPTERITLGLSGSIDNPLYTEA